MKAADLIDTRVMGNEKAMYDLFSYLRDNDPVPYVETSSYDPFWALTKYDDIKFVGSSNERGT